MTPCRNQDHVLAPKQKGDGGFFGNNSATVSSDLHPEFPTHMMTHKFGACP
jgi:hypothetical protein